MTIYFPEDVKTLKENIVELTYLGDKEVASLYEKYSEEMWCAGWLELDERIIEDFKDWLLVPRIEGEK